MIVFWLILGILLTPVAAALAFCVLITSWLVKGAYRLLHSRTAEEPEPLYLPETWTDTRTRV